MGRNLVGNSKLSFVEPSITKEGTTFAKIKQTERERGEKQR